MGQPNLSKGAENPNGEQEILTLDEMREHAKELKDYPGGPAMLALNHLNDKEPINSQVEGWNTFRVLLARILFKAREKGEKAFETELQGRTLEEAIEMNPRFLNMLANKLDLSPEEKVAVYKFNQFIGFQGEIGQQMNSKIFWKDILIASKGGRWDQYKRLWNHEPQLAMLFTVGAVFAAGLIFRKTSDYTKKIRDGLKEKTGGMDWFAPGGILTASAIGLAVMLAANWEKVLAAVGLDKITEMWGKVKGSGEISALIEAEVEKRLAQADAGKAKEGAGGKVEQAKKSEAAQSIVETGQEIMKDPYELTTMLFVRFGFFEREMEGAWNLNFLERSIGDMKAVSAQEIIEAVEIFENEEGGAIEAGYFEKIPSSSPFNQNLDDHQRFLLCQRMAKFVSLSELDSHRSLQDHFEIIGKSPMYDMNLKIHGAMLEKIGRGDLEDFFEVDFKKMDEEFFTEKGKMLLEHAQMLFDPELAKRIQSLNPEDRQVLGLIQFEMLRLTNMVERGQGGDAQGVASAIIRAKLKKEEINPEVITLAEDFFEATYLQSEKLLDEIYVRYQLPGHPENYVKNGLTMENLTFRHALELVLASKEMNWGEHTENPKHWIKDFTLLQIILKAMDEKERKGFTAGIVALSFDASTRAQIPFLKDLDPYFEGLKDYGAYKAHEWMKDAQYRLDSVGHSVSWLKPSTDAINDVMAVTGGMISLLMEAADLSSDDLPPNPSEEDAIKAIKEQNEKNKKTELFYDKVGDHVVLVIQKAGEYVFIYPVKTAVGAFEAWEQEGWISAVGSVAGRVALPATLGFLYALCTYTGDKSAEGVQVWRKTIPRLKVAGKGALKGAVWQYYFLKKIFEYSKEFGGAGAALVRKTVAAGHSFYSLRGGIESMTQTGRGIREGVLFSGHNLETGVRKMHFFEKYAKKVGLESPPVNLNVDQVAVVPDDKRSFLKRLRHEARALADEGLEGAGRFASIQLEKAKNALTLGIDEELLRKYAIGAEKQRLLFCGLSEADYPIAKNPTAEDLLKMLANQRAHISAIQKAAQNPNLEKDLLEILNSHKGEARKMALFEFLKSCDFPEDEARGLAKQIVGPGDAKLLVGNLRRGATLADELALKRGSARSTAPHIVDSTRVVDPSIDSSRTPDPTTKLQDLQKALDENQGKITELESKLLQKQDDLKKAQEAYERGRHSVTQNWIEKIEAEIIQLDAEKTTLLERNKVLLATKEILNPNATADALEAALKTLQAHGQEIYNKLQLTPDDEALKKAMEESNQLLQKAHYKLAELRNTSSPLDPASDATKALPEAVEATGRWAKSLKYIRRGVGVGVASFGAFSIWETGSSTLNTYRSYQEGRTEQGNLNAARTGMWGANAVIDTVGGAEILGTTFATQAPKLAQFAARNSVRAAGRVAIPLMAITYGGEKVYDTLNEQTLSEGQWLKKISSYEDLIYAFSTTAYSTSLGDLWAVGFGFNSAKENLSARDETMRRLFKVLVVLPDSPEVAEALARGANAKILDHIINESYTPYHDYFFRQVLGTFNSKDPAAIRQVIAEAHTFNQIMQLRDVAKTVQFPFFTVGKFNLLDERYNIQSSGGESTNAKNFDPQEIVKAYREERMGLTQEASEKLSREEKGILQAVKNMSTPYLLLLYAQLSESVRQAELNNYPMEADQKEVFIAYSQLISNELELNRYVLPSLDADQFREPPMSPEELSKHVENLENGNASSFRAFEKTHNEANPSVHAFYCLAQQLGYRGFATEEGLKHFFSEEKAPMFGIYWNGEQWMAQEAGWEKDSKMGSSLHYGTFGNIVRYLRINADDVLEHRHDTIFWSAGSFGNQVRAMVDTLEKGYTEGVKLYGPEKAGNVAGNLIRLASQTQGMAA